jgi:hypothetical protein
MMLKGGNGAANPERQLPSCMPCGLVWLNRHSRRVDTKMDAKRNTPSAPILRLNLVSILVSIFRPNRGDLVDFRDFGDCVGFR